MNKEKHSKIKKIMRKYDLTYHQIARLTNLSITTVYYWHYNENSFSPTHEFALLHKLRDHCNENILKLDDDILALKH